MASYRGLGRVSSKRIVASFGNLGRIDVRFRQTEGYRLHRPPRRCEGETRITRFGAYFGTIAFRGEHGYTTIDAKRAHGISRFAPHWKCKRRHRGKFVPKHESDQESKQTVLEAEARDPRIVTFNAFSGSNPGEQALFLAGVREVRGGMRISRFAFAPGSTGDFEFDEGLNSATVRPPKPFSGSATFAHGSGDSTRWTGTLRVALPGAPQLALAGKRFDVSLQQPPFLRPQALSWNGG